MFTKRALLAILAIGTLFSYVAFSGNDKVSDKEQLGKTLQAIVDGILKGTDLKKATSHVDFEAYLVDGKYFESLPGVLHGESTHCKLVEGKESRITFQSLHITDNLSAAYMVMKTQTPLLGERFHSVVFFRDSSAEWKINSWHISN